MKKISIVFLSNFYNHHQAFISNCINQITNGQYFFFSTSTMGDEQKALSYQMIYDDFAKDYYSDKSESDKRIMDADVVIFGSAPYELVVKRLLENKLVFQYSERIFKVLPSWYEIPARALKYWYLKGRFHNMYLLCASAFTYADYYRTKTFVNRAYKWGYFPETKKYDIESLMRTKDKTKLLWVGRFLEWKHPDDVLKVAKRLQGDGYCFSIDIGGAGELEGQLKDMANSYGVSECVTFLGAIRSDQVRSYMERAGIYLFTSDRYEGWGAVLNESMNSGCAVVASHLIGAVPYLMKHNENGLIYHSGNVNELYEKVKYLLNNPREQERLGKAAYETITDEWNAEIAAERLINLSEHLLSGEKHPDLYKTGPCSKAEMLKDDWY